MDPESIMGKNLLVNQQEFQFPAEFNHIVEFNYFVKRICKEKDEKVGSNFTKNII